MHLFHNRNTFKNIHIHNHNLYLPSRIIRFIINIWGDLNHPWIVAVIRCTTYKAIGFVVCDRDTRHCYTADVISCNHHYPYLRRSSYKPPNVSTVFCAVQSVGKTTSVLPAEPTIVPSIDRYNRSQMCRLLGTALQNAGSIVANVFSYMCLIKNFLDNAYIIKF